MAELTLEDIAKQVGVSRSTVSRVVNGMPNVNPEVRRQVLETIQLTGYHPNAAARSLALQRTSMIGLVLPRTVGSLFTDPFFPQLTQGIAFACNNHDLSLSLFLVGNKEDEEKISPRISRSGMLDGVLIQSGEPGDILIDHLLSSRIPSVMLGRPFGNEDISYVDVDNVNSAMNAIRHLIKLGYKRIATITGRPDRTVTIDRLEGYKRALIENNQVIDQTLIAEGDFSEVSGYEAMKKLLPAHPDAVFAASDIMAVGAIRALNEIKLRVPDDIAIVGYDDLPMEVLNKVQLTTVRQPIMKFGIKAVELLIDLIENGTSPTQRLILDTELVVRDTCGARNRENILSY